MQPKLHEAAHVIAYVDKPNANVGFEIGYALGRGNRDPQVEPAIVALALHAKECPSGCRSLRLPVSTRCSSKTKMR